MSRSLSETREETLREPAEDIANRPLTWATLSVKLERFVDQEEIRQQRAQVDRGVEVVDELRSDRRLREHEPDGRAGVPGVALDHVGERAIGRRVETCPLGDIDDEFAEPGERPVAA